MAYPGGGGYNPYPQQGGYPQPYGAPPQPYPGGSPYPPQPYPGGSPYPAQPYPGGSPYPGQPYPGGSPYPGQAYPGAPSPYPANPYPPQPYPGGASPYPNPYPAQPYPNPAQPYPNPAQAYPGAPNPYPPMGAPAHVPGATTTVTTVSTTAIPISFMPLYSYPPSNPDVDADRLYKAMKGLGTDDSVLIDIITHRSKPQLELISQCYLKRHKKTLSGAIKGDTSGNYRRLLRNLIIPATTFKVKNLRKAMQGVGTREAILIDILTQSSNAEIEQIKQLYQRLEIDLAGDTSGNFKKILATLCRGTRQEITTIDDPKAEAVAKEIFEAGEFRLGTNDSKFVDIFTKYSPYFLDRVNAHYRRLYGHSMLVAIERETSGYYKETLIALTKPPDVYFADRLKQAMRGIGTDDWGLVYIFCVHDRAQLKHIAKVYSTRGHGDLAHDIERDTSGEYKKTLLSLIS